MAQAFWIAGQRITREELDETKIGYVQQLLGYDHAHGVRPTCMCRSPGITMSVRKLGSRYVLAKMPDSGPTHALLCDSYALPNAMTGRSGYHLKAIEEGDDGSAIVRLDAALRKQTDKLVTKPAQRIQPGRTVVKRDSTTLAGLLQYGWERMGLNRWSPKMKGEDGRSKRGWWTVHKEGNDWLAQLKIGRDRAPQVMIIPPSLQVQ